MSKTKIALLILISVFIGACATYYQRSQKFQEAFAGGEIEKADEIIGKDKKGPEGKNRLLYFLNRGLVKYMLGKNQESIELLSEAEKYIEDQQKNLGQEALSLLINPTIKPYKPEDFENVMVNFFMAMNFLELNKYNDAIVECKRINIKLNELNDKYKDHKNRYQRDAFANIFQGLMYEASGNFNDAFIAYRNAFETYESDYSKNFGLNAPMQLKKDLLKTAYKTGFYDEVDFYEKKFNMKYTPEKNEGGELVFFWLNGLGPVKSEWSINFTIIQGQGGYVTFANDDLGISFPYYVGDKPQNEQNALANLHFTRIAFPKYLERKPVYHKAELVINNKTLALEEAQDINAIAFKTLNDRMLREIGNSLLRFATKKALEKLVEQQNDQLGTLVSIANAVTEKADTRNWQTLPYMVSYTKVALPAGQNTLQLKTYGRGNEYQMQTFTFDIPKGKMKFYTYYSLESYPPANE